MGMGSLEGQKETKMAFSSLLDDVAEELIWMRKNCKITKLTDVK